MSGRTVRTRPEGDEFQRLNLDRQRKCGNGLEKKTDTHRHVTSSQKIPPTSYSNCVTVCQVTE